MKLSSTAQRRKIYLIILTVANVLIISSVYVGYYGLPHSIPQSTPTFSETPSFSETPPSETPSFSDTPPSETPSSKTPSSETPSPETPSFSEYLRLSTPQLGIATPWVPLSLSQCSFGMPTYYAPCAAQKMRNVAYAEELVYPGFEIREPFFAREEHREAWRKATLDITDRAVLYAGWMAYRGQSGQNFVCGSLLSRSFNQTALIDGPA